MCVSSDTTSWWRMKMMCKSTNSSSRHWMDVWLAASLGRLICVKPSHPTPIVQKVERASEPVWTSWSRKWSATSAWNRTNLGRPAQEHKNEKCLRQNLYQSNACVIQLGQRKCDFSSHNGSGGGGGANGLHSRETIVLLQFVIHGDFRRSCIACFLPFLCSQIDEYGRFD